MRILYLDCFSGISGDMTVGALLDLGVSLETIESHLERLGVGGYTVARNRGRDGALAGTRFLVQTIGADDPGGAAPPPAHRPTGTTPLGKTPPHAEHGRPVEPRPEAPVTPVVPPISGHPHAHRHGHGHGAVHRTYQDIVRLLETSDLPAPARHTALRIFAGLARAESRVHGIPEDEVAFHEVGAVDSIVDIVSVALALHLLEVDEVQCSPLPVAQGSVECQHGSLPLPAPATLELLKGLPIRGTDRGAELVTPTGAAIVSALARRVGPLPAMIPEAIGYGLGQRRGGRTPNALRAVLGRTTAASTGTLSHETVEVLEADIDDMNPQFYQPLMDRLFSLGALDVTLTPLVMKKTRPGVLVRVVCPPDSHDKIAETLIEETTTLGVRYHAMTRTCAVRTHETVETRFGPIRVKLGMRDGRITNLMPEFEDCRTAADRHGVSVKIVHQEAVHQALAHGFDGRATGSSGEQEVGQGDE